jgi:hypothetical protein
MLLNFINKKLKDVREIIVHPAPIVVWIIIVIHNVLFSFFYDFFSNLFLSISSFKIEIVKNLTL